MTCQDCGSKMSVEQTIPTAGQGADVLRVNGCPCGSRFMSEEKITLRLPQAKGTGGVRVHTGGVPAPPRQGTNPPAVAGGVGGGLPEISVQAPISALNPIASKPQAQTRVERPSTTETAAFIAFYEAYPRKKQRPDAVRAWVKQGCELVADAVMAGLRAHLPELTTREPDKVPYPASWLNATEWKDPPLPARATDLRCHFHRSPGTLGKRPPAGYFAACPECKHARAGGGTRTGEPATIADLAAATEKRLAAQRSVVPATREELEGLRQRQ